MHDPTEGLALQELKHRARILRRDQSLRYHDALQVAAREAGFENHAHARRSLSTQNVVEVSRADTSTADAPTFTVRLKAEWSQFDGHRVGVEQGSISLFQPLSALIHDAASVQGCISLQLFQKSETSNYLELIEAETSQNDAQRHVHCASQELWLMDISGLRPVEFSLAAIATPATIDDERERQLWAFRHQPPGLDHASSWVDPQTGKMMLIDQPYPMTERDIDARALWAEQHDYQMALPPWIGTYSRDTDCVFYSHRGSGLPLEPILQSIDRQIRRAFRMPPRDSEA